MLLRTSVRVASVGKSSMRGVNEYYGNTEPTYRNNQVRGRDSNRDLLITPLSFWRRVNFYRQFVNRDKFKLLIA